MPISQSDIKKVAEKEKQPLALLTSSLKKGESLIITSKRKGIEPLGIGKGLRAKFASIVGTSSDQTNIASVIRKARIAIRSGACVIHNGSTGGNIDAVQKALLETTTVPLATCHPLAVMGNACRNKISFIDVKARVFLDRVKKDIDDGVEVILLPIGVTKKTVRLMAQSKRLMPCCGKSGSLMAAWIAHTKQENPYSLYFDEILAMAKDKNVTLSIVAAFRSGCLHDALDNLQYEELKTIKDYTDRAKAAGVGIKAGSGGHLPADKISSFFSYQKTLLKTPIISFGPQVTDISLGFDHVSSAMGELIALMSGADIIFSMTPAEHISMPNEKETEQGCVSAHLACHAADIARGKDLDKDLLLSKAREDMQWRKQAVFAPTLEIKKKLGSLSLGKKGCSVCGNFCAHELKSFMKKRTRVP